MPILPWTKRFYPSLPKPASRRIEVGRRWVETADERCPLACVWFALPESADDRDEEPGSLMPVFSAVREKTGWFQRFHIRFIYSV